VDACGHPRLRHAIGDYFRRVRAVAGRVVTICQGAQDAFSSLAQLLVRPGDRVAVECPGYPFAWEAFRLAGAELVPIPVDEQGLCVEALEREARRRPVTLLYTTPLHQFPTTVTLSRERRRALLEVTARARIVVVEDDYDHELHYGKAPPAPLAAQAGADHVVYVGTLSKALYPSARVAAVASSEAIAPHLDRLRRATLRTCDGLTQLALALWIEEGGLERHLRRVRRIYEGRRNAFVDALRERFAGPGLLSFEPPGGGLAVWARLRQQSATEVARRALAKGVLLLPEGPLWLGAAEDAHLRFGFAAHTRVEARNALATVANVLGS
jgi:GntR family transcriptional regulator/MocR family aminotransferase